MIIQAKNIPSLMNFVISVNEEDSEWSIEYAAPGFYFYTNDSLLESAINHYMEQAE